MNVWKYFITRLRIKPIVSMYSSSESYLHSMLMLLIRWLSAMRPSKAEDEKKLSDASCTLSAVADISSLSLSATCSTYTK